MTKKETPVVDLDHKKIADIFMDLSVLYSTLSATFRGGSASEVDSGGDGEVEKPVRGRKPAAGSSTKSSKPVKGGAAETPEITEDSLRAALSELGASRGKAAVTKALATVGAGRLPDVDEDDYQALHEAIQKLSEEEEDEAPAKKTPAKKTAAKKAPVPDIDELTESFKKLIDADKPAAKKILKDAGLAKLTEIDTDDDDAMREMAEAIEAAMPEDDDIV
jgi:hypothetical protein